MLRMQKGQSTLEYALIIAVVVGALLAMQIYMKRGMEGRMRKAADDIGKQFDAEKTYVHHTTTKTGTTVEETASGATTVYSGGSPAGAAQGAAEETKFSGKEVVDSLDKY
ncbi:MAG: hypothetical protein PHE18_01585 [Candidatus Omnitrophica bacterium]|nr:hypothetical protein [Candidatus Omnitrophota bacterium]MDD5552546.1 hypothetical protein [Candidatus Omnitrophota bacterium]